MSWEFFECLFENFRQHKLTPVCFFPLTDLEGISTYALLAIVRRFAAGRLVGASSGSEVSRSLEGARFLLVVERVFVVRALVARFFVGSSSMSDMGVDSVSLTEAEVLKMGDTLVDIVREVEDGDARLRADHLVTRGIDVLAQKTERKEIFIAWVATPPKLVLVT